MTAVAETTVRTSRQPATFFLSGRSWLLRIGLAFVFAYAGTKMLVDPSTFAKYLPAQLAESSSSTTLLEAFAIYELVLVVGILSRRFLTVSALASAATLGSIVALNLDEFEVLFRNVAIIAAALSLAFDQFAASSRRGRSPEHDRV